LCKPTGWLQGITSIKSFSLLIIPEEFVRRNGQFSVNIGLCHDNFPVLGVVCVPCKSSFSKESLPRVYYALDGHGAYVRQLPPTVDDTSPDAPDQDDGVIVEMTPQRLECKEFFESDENLRIVMSSLGAVSPLRASLSSSDLTPERLLSRYKNPVIISTSGSSILHRSDSGFPASDLSTPSSAADSTNHHPSSSKPSITIPPYALSSQLGSQSIVLNILLLAEGKADCYPRLSMSCEWNTCAAHAILNEAGGEIVQLANGMDNSTQCIPGEQLIYNKPHPINPYFVAYGKRLIPAHLLSHDYGLGIPAGLPTNAVSTSTGNSELESKYYTMLAIQAKQEELKRLLDLQDLEYEKSLQEQRQQQQQQEGDDDEEVDDGDEGSPAQEQQSDDVNVVNGKDEVSGVELNRPKTLSLSLGLFGIFVAVAVCCLGVLYQIQHKPINL
jgi:3'-phosphoadenosine 5'-phosphosulfate (PAPS) 3'-phosphatase